MKNVHLWALLLALLIALAALRATVFNMWRKLVRSKRVFVRLANSGSAGRVFIVPSGAGLSVNPSR